MIMLYQIIATLFGIIAILLSILRFRDGKMSIGMLFLWILIWLLVIFIAFDPQSTSELASLTGIGRGLDLVLILGLLLSFYLIFRMYNKIENIEEELTNLTREIAISNAKKAEEEIKNDNKRVQSNNQFNR